MAKDNYTIGQGKPQQPRPHGPGAVSVVEKPADFKGTWAKLIDPDSNQQSKTSVTRRIVDFPVGSSGLGRVSWSMYGRCRSVGRTPKSRSSSSREP